MRAANGEDRKSVQEELAGEDNFNEWYESLMNEMAGILNE